MTSFCFCPPDRNYGIIRNSLIAISHNRNQNPIRKPYPYPDPKVQIHNITDWYLIYHLIQPICLGTDWPCITPDGNIGDCRALDTCRPLNDLVKDGVLRNLDTLTLLRLSHCGFEEVTRKPKVSYFIHLPFIILVRTRIPFRHAGAWQAKFKQRKWLASADNVILHESRGATFDPSVTQNLFIINI